MQDHGWTEKQSVLRPDEIFRDIPENTVAKKRAFNGLNAAVQQEALARRRLASAKTPAARAAAEKALAKADANVATATDHLKNFIVEARLPKDREIDTLKSRLAHARSHHEADKVARLEAALKTAESEARSRLRSEVDAMVHTDPGHEHESVFAPVETEVGYHDYTGSVRGEVMRTAR